MSAILLGAALVAGAVLLGGGRRSAGRARGRRPGALTRPGTRAVSAAPSPVGSVLAELVARRRAAAAEPASVRGTADVARACARLAALLRAGVPAPAAWQHLAAVAGPVPAAGGRAGGGGPVSSAVRRAAHAARTGGDVAAALRGAPPGGGAGPGFGWAAVAGPRTGAAGAAGATGVTGVIGAAEASGTGPRGREEPADRALAAVAAAWQVAERSGAPPAEVLERLAAGLTADRDAALARESALAAPRSTAVVLLVLPLAGLGLGVLLGVDPVGVLVGTEAGRGCLLVGVLSTAGGWWWTRRLVRGAERTS